MNNSEPTTGEKVELGIDLAAAKRMLAEAMPEIVAKYNAIAEGDLESMRKPGIWEQQIFFSRQLPSDVNMTVLASKRFTVSAPENIEDGNYPPHIPGEKKEFFQIFIQRGLPTGTSQQDLRDIQSINEEVAAFFLQKKGDTWLITHREVSPYYREQRIGSLLFEAVYDYLQVQANATGKKQTLFAHIGQPSTLMFFGKKKFLPRSDEDRKRAMEILAHDPKLVFEHAQKREIDEDGRPTGNLIPETWKDPFVFEAKKPGRTELDCYYLELEKTFLPEAITAQVTQICDSTKTAIENA